MSNRVKIIIILALLVVPGFLLPRFGSDAVTASVAVQPEVLFSLHLGSFDFEISNTLLTTWIVMILLFLFAFFATRKMALVPSGLQNLMELIVEMLMGLCESVAGHRGRKFFPIVATIFLFVLFSNWLGLVPGFGPVGYIPEDKKHPAPAGITTFDLGEAFDKAIGPKEHHGEGVVLAPFVRSPSTDMNMTLALALISVVMTQVYGMQQIGVIKYWGRFFNFTKLGGFFSSLFKGKPNFGLFGFGIIDFFVAFLEFISEIVKVLSFTFRLFGNIFAGEVVLLIMAFLFFALPFPFYALEVFVGFMQAFVFAILTLVFMTIATTAHSAEEHH